ncbi:hypothetical protein FSP39_021670 [Pinctada imbricata]|uniref:Pappalysin-1 SD scarf domain-containing protein n=1 Tax=Pinctada imbricata TaxID=66713 RepID=A0AA89CBG2_PINIB|nr:hypothetical protein FSP39_021670 [Pinctada imbricata]
MRTLCEILLVVTCVIFVRCDTNSEDITIYIPTQFQVECLNVLRDISLDLKNISAKIGSGNYFKNELQTILQSLKTATMKNVSAIERDFSLKIATLEKRVDEYETFATRSFEKVTFDVDSLNSSLSQLDASSCKCLPVSTNAEKVSLWVSIVRGYSSQYNSGSWSANQVIGKANVYPAYGDKVNTWAQSPNQLTANQYIEVGFAETLYVDKVNIYETYNAGGVKEIKFLNPSGLWETVWKTSHVQQITTSRIFSPKIKKTDYPTDILHITVDCTLARMYVEIDAIEIIGTRPSSEVVPDVELWVSSIKGYSSQHNTGSWAAIQVIGNPDVYPAYGDKQNTWAQASGQFTANQYIQVGYTESLYIKQIHIYETYNAGGVKEIKSLNPSGQWETIWSTNQAQRIQTSRIFSPPIKRTSFPTDTLHITVDCTVAGTYVEIDAIQIKGSRTNGKRNFRLSHKCPHVRLGFW